MNSIRNSESLLLRLPLLLLFGRTTTAFLAAVGLSLGVWVSTKPAQWQKDSNVYTDNGELPYTFVYFGPPVNYQSCLFLSISALLIALAVLRIAGLQHAASIRHLPIQAAVWVA